jgi:hypothetical protein
MYNKLESDFMLHKTSDAFDFRSFVQDGPKIMIYKVLYTNVIITLLYQVNIFQRIPSIYYIPLKRTQKIDTFSSI